MTSRSYIILAALLHLAFLCYATCHEHGDKDWPLAVKWLFLIFGTASFAAGVALCIIAVNSGSPVTELWVLCLVLQTSHICEVSLEAPTSLR